MSRAGFVAIISAQVVIQPSYQLLSHEFRKVLNHHFLTELGKVRIVSDRALPCQTPAVSSALKEETVQRLVIGSRDPSLPSPLTGEPPQTCLPDWSLSLLTTLRPPLLGILSRTLPPVQTSGETGPSRKQGFYTTDRRVQTRLATFLWDPIMYKQSWAFKQSIYNAMIDWDLSCSQNVI